MSNDLNQCNFIGRLGKDVETRYTPGGDAVASFSIAVGSTRKNKQGQKQESVEWVNCTAFGKLAEIMDKYLQKGSKVFINGRMKTDKYQDKTTGADKYSTGIIVNNMQMLDSRNDNQGSVGQQGQQQAQQQAPQSRQVGAGDFDDFDDDIPF
ncbi:MAG: single-stranded DNA-binding protein [Gammaproteobacteria bacterium]|nr:single-stranded DNA-binding protein [Gammaproteobacteria bacterium]